VLQLEAKVSDADCALAAQSSLLSGWENRWTGFEPELDSRLTQLKVGIDERYMSLDRIANDTARVADEDRNRLERIDRTLENKRDRARMWNDLVGPVVQLAGDSTVGSGVLLESRPTNETDKWQTHLLTAWHVVRDIYGTPDKTDAPVPVKMYLANGNVQFEHAHLVAHDVKLDVALLLLDSEHRVPCGARLPSRQRLENVRIFDPVYAVGCPLGNDPIPTCGEIAATQHEVDNERYWMISAPTYIGNSGGGIFDAESHELLGIFSKIYTHGALRSTIVPHMGLATPLITVYDWLEHEGLADVEQQSPVGEPAMAAASR
jgi:S1-C subfamily serine protease